MPDAAHVKPLTALRFFAAFWVVMFYVVAAILAPILAATKVLNWNGEHQNLLNIELGGVPKGSWGGTSWHHLLGVEPRTGTDLLARMWYGITFSLTIALTATIIAVVIGTVLGIVSGFAGGWVDWFIGRFIDLTLSFPQTLMLLALSATGVALFAKFFHADVLDVMPNAVYEVLVLGLFGWPSVARLIRGQVLSLREREFVDAARLLGASRRRLYFKEMLPNLWAPVLVQFTLIMPAYVSAEAALEAARASIPDVMLVDIGLPGMNGYELAEHVRKDETLRGITLVAVTGYGREEDRQRALAAGFDHHIVKPVEHSRLMELLARS